MLIDWFTVIAMIFNFLLLVWILQRFLYKPILRAIDEREKKIASQMEEAEKIRQEASALSEEYRQKNEKFDRRQVERELEMRDEIKRERERLLEQANLEAEKNRQKHDEVFRREAGELEEAFHRRMGEVVTTVSEKILRDLSDEALEARIIDVFVKRLQSVDPDEVSSMRHTAGSNKPIIITVSGQIKQDRRRQLEEAVRKALSDQAEIRFETDASLVCGLAVTWGSFRIAWNLADYLESLEKNVDHLIDQQKTAK